MLATLRQGCKKKQADQCLLSSFIVNGKESLLDIYSFSNT